MAKVVVSQDVSAQEMDELMKGTKKLELEAAAEATADLVQVDEKLIFNPSGPDPLRIKGYEIDLPAPEDAERLGFAFGGQPVLYGDGPPLPVIGFSVPDGGPRYNVLEEMGFTVEQLQNGSLVPRFPNHSEASVSQPALSPQQSGNLELHSRQTTPQTAQLEYAAQQATAQMQQKAQLELLAAQRAAAQLEQQADYAPPPETRELPPAEPAIHLSGTHLTPMRYATHQRLGAPGNYYYAQRQPVPSQQRLTYLPEAGQRQVTYPMSPAFAPREAVMGLDSRKIYATDSDGRPYGPPLTVMSARGPTLRRVPTRQTTQPPLVTPAGHVTRHITEPKGGPVIPPQQITHYAPPPRDPTHYPPCDPMYVEPRIVYQTVGKTPKRHKERVDSPRRTKANPALCGTDLMRYSNLAGSALQQTQEWLAQMLPAKQQSTEKKKKKSRRHRKTEPVIAKPKTVPHDTPPPQPRVMPADVYIPHAVGPPIGASPQIIRQVQPTMTRYMSPPARATMAQSPVLMRAVSTAPRLPGPPQPSRSRSPVLLPTYQQGAWRPVSPAEAVTPAFIRHEPPRAESRPPAVGPVMLGPKNIGNYQIPLDMSGLPELLQEACFKPGVTMKEPMVPTGLPETAPIPTMLEKPKVLHPQLLGGLTKEQIEQAKREAIAEGRVKPDDNADELVGQVGVMSAEAQLKFAARQREIEEETAVKLKEAMEAAVDNNEAESTASDSADKVAGDESTPAPKGPSQTRLFEIADENGQHRVVEVVTLCEAPRIDLLRSFLVDAEVEKLKQLVDKVEALPHVPNNLLLDGALEGDDRQFVLRIINRACQMTGLSASDVVAFCPSVITHTAMDATKEFSNIIRMYLDEFEEGGDSDFPYLGITVSPQKGSTIRWCAKNSNGYKMARATHSEAVGEGKGPRRLVTAYVR